VHGLLRPAVKTGDLPGQEEIVKLDWVRIDDNGTHHSPLSEAFRSLRTSVLLSTASQPPRSLTVVSAEPGEGKTTISCNLAISLGQLGKRVLLIDCDMRRPRLHKVFAINERFGLSSYLAGHEGWRNLVRPTGAAGVDCIVCGPVPPNPSELLSSEPMQRLISEAIQEYQFVLVDSPPLLSVADGRILASLVDGTILVVKASVTPRELVKRGESYIRDVGGRLIGAVLNDVNLKSDGYYGYGSYRYGYGQYGEYRDHEEGAAKAAGAAQ
jgi:capsular exopolysaccharide synthesis family protein